MKPRMALLLLPILIAGPAGALTLDVAPGGPLPSPALAQAAVRRWRTEGHATEMATIRIAPGTYTLETPLVFTAEDHHLVIEASEPGRVLLSGGVAVEGWTPGPDGCWRARLPEGLDVPEQLYVDGRRAPRARSPNDGFFLLESVAQTTNADGSATLELGVPPAALAAFPAEGATIHIFHKWDTTRARVTGVEASNRLLRVQSTAMKSWNKLEKGRRFRIENSPLACDAPGEWVVSADRQVILRGEKPENVTAPRLERLVELRGASNLVFRGLRFEYAAYRLPPLGDPAAQAASFVEAAVQADQVSDVLLEDCAIAHTGGYALWFRRGCTGGVARRGWFHDLGAGGVRIGESAIRDAASDQTGGIVLEDSIVEAIGRVHPSAVGVWIGQSANNRVTGCEVRDTYYSGFSVGWTWGYGRSLATNNLVAGNFIHRIGQGMLCDLGGIYTLGVSPGTELRGNLITDVRAYEYGGWGLYTDEGSTGIQLISNVVLRTTCATRPERAGGFHQHYGATNRVAFNVFADASGPQIQASRVEDHLSFRFEHNTVINDRGALFGGTWNAAGPWKDLRVELAGNRYFSLQPNAFAESSFTAWTQRWSEAGSKLEAQRPEVLERNPAAKAGPRWQNGGA